MDKHTLQSALSGIYKEENRLIVLDRVNERPLKAFLYGEEDDGTCIYRFQIARVSHGMLIKDFIQVVRDVDGKKHSQFGANLESSKVSDPGFPLGVFHDALSLGEFLPIRYLLWTASRFEDYVEENSAKAPVEKHYRIDLVDRYCATAWITASDEDEAIQKVENGEYDEYERGEWIDSEDGSMTVKEV